MKKFYKTIMITVVLIGSAAFGDAPSAETGSANVKPTSLPQNVLGRAYVDIRYGFSLRPPYGAQLSRVQTAWETVTQKQPSGEAEESELLRLPESKELVRFHQEASQTTLAVNWMVIKQRDFTIDKMREIREQYWQKFPTQATLQQSQTDSHNGLASAFVSVTWKTSETDAVPLLIQETLIQCEPSRFFMLALTRPVQDKSDRDAAEKLMAAVVKNFEYFDKKQQEQRRRDARLLAQKWLGALSFKSIKDTLTPQRWFRIRNQQEDIGFLRITEQLETVQEKTVIEFRCDSVLAENSLSEKYIQWRGYAKGLAQTDTPENNTWDSIWLQEEYHIAGDVKAEQFLAALTDRKHPRKCYREQGDWKPGNLTVTRFDDPDDKQKSFTETLKVNDKFFLSGGVDGLLYRLLPVQSGEEYLFLRYTNRALRFYSLRVAGRETLTITTTPASEKKNDSETPQEKETKIPTTYLVGQVGLDGAIVETWIDKTGRIIKIRTNDDLILLSSNLETIQTLWPEQVEQLQGASNNSNSVGATPRGRPESKDYFTHTSIFRGSLQTSN
jgi:hypothetical protein